VEQQKVVAMTAIGPDGGRKLDPPPYPADTDLTMMRELDLHIASLERSTFFNAATHEEFGAGMRLWIHAWHEVPAGSLPNDEQALAGIVHLRNHMARWARIKRNAMRGWKLHADGRLYHPFMVKLVLRAVANRDAYRERMANAANARWGKSKTLDFNGLDASCIHDASVVNPGVGVGVGVTPKTTGAKPGAAVAWESIDLPAFVDRGTWVAYVTHRRQMRKPLTATTVSRLLANFATWHTEGHNVNAAIDQATTAGWQGIQKPKGTPTKGKQSMADRMHGGGK